MLIWVLVGVALAVTVAVGAATWPVGPARRAQMADKFARDVDLALSPELVPVVGERLVRRGRLAVISVGLAAGAVVIYLGSGGAGEDPDDPGVAASYLGLLAIMQLSLAVGMLAVQAVEYARQGADRPRTAHLARPRVDDFATPLELWWSRGSALLAVLVAGFLVARDPGRASLLGLLAGCAGLWLPLELAARAVVGARPAASDVQSLAFDDALRSQTVRALLRATAFLPFAVWVPWTSLGLPMNAFYYALLLVVVVSQVLSGWAFYSARARLHYKNRLWASPLR
jgi:hypothetical protein